MSEQRQEGTYSDLERKKTLSSSPIVAKGSDQEVSVDTEISPRTVMGRQSSYRHLIQELEKAKCGIRRVQPATLSRVVNKAFTGWTIKTQREA